MIHMKHSLNRSTPGCISALALHAYDVSPAPLHDLVSLWLTLFLWYHLSQFPTLCVVLKIFCIRQTNFHLCVSLYFISSWNKNLLSLRTYFTGLYPLLSTGWVWCYFSVLKWICPSLHFDFCGSVSSIRPNTYCEEHICISYQRSWMND